MKKSLTEELNRMHSMMYGKQIDESEFIDKFLKNIGFRKEDDPIKADFVEDDLEEFYDTVKQKIECRNHAKEFPSENFFNDKEGHSFARENFS